MAKPSEGEPCSSMQDKLGQEITVGCYIAYGHALGRCAALKIGKVLKLRIVQLSEYRRYDPPHRITVVGVDDDMAHFDLIRYPPKLSKIGTLQFPDRVIVLDPKLIPKGVKSLLDSFEWKG